MGKGSVFNFTISGGEAEKEIEAEPSSTIAVPEEFPLPLADEEKESLIIISKDDAVTWKVLGIMLQWLNFSHFLLFTVSGR